MNGVAVCRKLVAIVVVALSGSGILVATSATPGAAAAGGCAGTAYVTNYAGRHGVGDHHGDGCGVGPHHRQQGSGCGVVAITPDGKHAYVTNLVDGTVSVITTATGAVSAPITVGKGPIGVAITPDGKHAYVTNAADDTVSVITTATGAVSAPITVGKGPAWVAITPDGKHAYVTNRRRGRHGVGDHDGDGCGVGPHHRRQGSARGGDHP